MIVYKGSISISWATVFILLMGIIMGGDLVLKCPIFCWEVVADVISSGKHSNNIVSTFLSLRFSKTRYSFQKQTTKFKMYGLSCHSNKWNTQETRGIFLNCLFCYFSYTTGKTNKTKIKTQKKQLPSNTSFKKAFFSHQDCTEPLQC